MNLADSGNKRMSSIYTDNRKQKNKQIFLSSAALFIQLFLIVISDS